MTRLTENHEAKFEQPWKVSDAPADYIEGMLKAIVAFEMPISRIEASWKLSQNRSEADRTGAMEGLTARDVRWRKRWQRLFLQSEGNE